MTETLYGFREISEYLLYLLKSHFQCPVPDIKIEIILPSTYPRRKPKILPKTVRRPLFDVVRK